MVVQDAELATEIWRSADRGQAASGNIYSMNFASGTHSSGLPQRRGDSSGGNRTGLRNRPRTRWMRSGQIAAPLAGHPVRDARARAAFAAGTWSALCQGRRNRAESAARTGTGRPPCPELKGQGCDNARQYRLAPTRARVHRSGRCRRPSSRPAMTSHAASRPKGRTKASRR